MTEELGVSHIMELLSRRTSLQVHFILHEVNELCVEVALMLASR